MRDFNTLNDIRVALEEVLSARREPVFS